MHKVITTEKRGVFFGNVVGVGEDVTGRYVEIEDAQMCVYWDTNTRGVLGLAATGPTSKCRITRPVPGVSRLGFVTWEGPATEEAIKQWHSCPWHE